MATLTAEQIQEKKLQIVEKLKEIKQLRDEIVAGGAVELTEEELDNVSGGRRIFDLIRELGPNPLGVSTTQTSAYPEGIKW